MSAARLQPPAIGESWPGQGGIYLGVVRAEDGQPDAYLVMAADAAPKRLAWKKALEWAKTVEADGHSDFHVPTRTESALIYTNGRHLVDAGKWHWTSTQYSEGVAFRQDFSDGSQIINGKGQEACVRAVRRLPLQPFDPSES